MKIINLDGLIISNLNNPNGQVFTNKELKYIYNFCKKNKIILIVDEIYHGIEYQQRNQNQFFKFWLKCLCYKQFFKIFLYAWLEVRLVVPEKFHR